MSNWEIIVHSLGFRFVFIALFISNLAFSQEIPVLSKVTKDSIAIKWLPTNFEDVLSISKGATVSRIASSETENFESLDFNGAKTWKVGVLTDRAAGLDENNAEDEKFLTLLDPILNGANEEQQNFAFGTVLVENVSNPDFQELLGNVLVDKSFDRGTKYVYKIQLQNRDPLFISIDPKNVTEYSNIDLSLELDQKTTVVASWNYADIIKESFAFQIEHSVGKKQEGSYVSEQPFMPFKSADDQKTDAEFRQEDLEKGKMHYYRVSGLDAFGVPSLFSEWKEIYVPNSIDAFVKIDSINPLGINREVSLSILGLNDKSGIESVEMWRSSDRRGDYELVSSEKPTDSTLKMTIQGEKQSGDHFYYVAKLVNKDDTVSSIPFYFFTLDQEPPSPPTELNVTIDSSGIAQLNWLAPIDTDLQGYRVFRGNQKREEFVELSRRLSLETVFLDTLALDNLTSEVYYYLISVDENYNKSVHSDTIMGLKPDTIAPVPCVLKNVSMVENGLFIEWINSDSEDVANTELIRNDGMLLPASGTSYLDTNVSAGKGYSYALRTTDFSENASFSKEVYRFYEPGFRAAMECTATVDLEKHGILLSWKRPKFEIYAIEIYRSKGSAKITHYKTFTDSSSINFFDENVRLGEKYTYSIKYITSDGIHSIPAVLEVQY